MRFRRSQSAFLKSAAPGAPLGAVRLARWQERLERPRGRVTRDPHQTQREREPAGGGTRAPRGAGGNEQGGGRDAVIGQSEDLLLSTVLVAPTSRSALPRIFRPTITIGDEKTQVLIEQTTAVAPERLGELVGHVSHDELEQINNSLRLALELD